MKTNVILANMFIVTVVFASTVATSICDVASWGGVAVLGAVSLVIFNVSAHEG